MPRIDDYSFGSMTVDGKVYNRDLIIFPHCVQANWWRKEGHSLAVEDLEDVLEAKPEILVIGQGYSGCMEVPLETKKLIEGRQIQLIAKKTGEALHIFNRERASGKKVVGAFHLTC